MNPHLAHSVSPSCLFSNLWHHRELIAQMTKRDIVGRYKGSIMGLGWSFFNPVLMLVVYTFVFSVVLEMRWGIGKEESRTDFAIVLFAGLIIHALFAEVINKAPTLILGNVNYVKKVVFPLEMLPVVAMGGALFHSVISLCVLLIAFAVLNGYINWTAVFLPLILFPLMLITLGFAWLITSLGVYVRDIGQAIGLITTVMLFLAPVFYPITAIPDAYQNLLYINPLTFIIEQSRLVLIAGQLPHWSSLAIYFVISLLIAWSGYAWFQKTRNGFSDVL